MSFALPSSSYAQYFLDVPTGTEGDQGQQKGVRGGEGEGEGEGEETEDEDENGDGVRVVSDNNHNDDNDNEIKHGNSEIMDVEGHKDDKGQGHGQALSREGEEGKGRVIEVSILPTEETADSTAADMDVEVEVEVEVEIEEDIEDLEKDHGLIVATL